jgi:hypothetical protein
MMISSAKKEKIASKKAILHMTSVSLTIIA